ncbi:substrate-binding domain-containing protein [Neobacillus niacini]|uniref:substrate-binding domain-containing protein n=1 Tax=Neobacillus niacini TaxID=86668 RepID=UPI001C8E37A8|nr:substrate-binding domain-containing protein [Neobacillus niacini]MBY0149242.1 substrate-binding domain-containing protein [Neobacillus niacini]
MNKKVIFGTMLFGTSMCLFLLYMFGQTEMNGSASDQQEVDYVIGVSQPNLHEPWQVLMNEELKNEVAKHENIRVIYTDAAQSTEQQIRDIQTLKEYGIDLLIVSIDNSSDLTPIISDMYKEIPVIVLGRGVTGYNYTLYIGSDYYFIGETAAKAAMNLLGNKGGSIVEIQGITNALQAEERSKGFQETLHKNPAYKISDVLVANWQRDDAEDQLKLLLQHRDNPPDLIYAHNDAMALGAYRAIQSLGLKDIIIIGSDGVNKHNGGLQLVQEKKINTTFITPTGGKEAIQYAIEILGKKEVIPKKIILRNHEIDETNIKNYLTEKEMTASSHEGVRDHSLTLGFAQVGNESEFRAANTQSIVEAAKEAGVELLLKNADNDQEKQIEIIRDFIKQKVDVIAFSPKVEHGWEEVLREAKEAGIPVILSDREINVKDSSLWTSFIGSDFVEEGRRAARWLVNEEASESVHIIELEGTRNSAPAEGRKQGFEEILAENPNFKILKSYQGDFTHALGKKMMKNALEQYGKDIDVVYAHNDDMAIGAIEAIEEFGLKPGSEIRIISIDATKKAFRALSTGKLNFSVECNPLLGPQIMKSAKDLVLGKEIPMKIITAERTFTQEEAGKEIKKRNY